MSRPPQHHNNPAPAAAAAPDPAAVVTPLYVPVINPNLPLPVVLSSDLAPPPAWPIARAHWVSLPVVPAGFPAGPWP